MTLGISKSITLRCAACVPLHMTLAAPVAVDSTINEAQVQFRVENEPVLALYAITGENRETRAQRGNRMALRRQTSVVYAGELLDGAKKWDYDDEQLVKDFRLIVLSWRS